MLSIIGLIPTILTFLTGLSGTVGKVSDNIKELEVAREKTKSDTQLKQIDSEIAVQHDRKDVLVAEAGNRINAVMRALLAVGPILYVFKYYAIDKVVGSFAGCAGVAGKDAGCWVFNTDGLNTEMAAVMTACLGFYMLASWRK